MSAKNHKKTDLPLVSPRMKTSNIFVNHYRLSLGAKRYIIKCLNQMNHFQMVNSFHKNSLPLRWRRSLLNLSFDSHEPSFHWKFVGFENHENPNQNGAYSYSDSNQISLSNCGGLQAKEKEFRIIFLLLAVKFCESKFRKENSNLFYK